MMANSSYAIALGSNQWHGRHGPPEGVVTAAIDALGALGTVEQASAIHITPALGPAGRDFANAAAILSTPLAPDALLAALKAIERGFGRRPGRRWGPRVLDLDIILWSQGRRRGARLALPHPDYRTRAFVLAPLAEIAPDWRDPISGLAVRHLLARLTAPRPAPR
jgi:2-amino-4-hydroxy-6-hydroxymethyldihydropteridine diphosphokinase